MAQLTITGGDSRRGQTTLLPYVALTWVNADDSATTTHRWGGVPFDAPEGAVSARVLNWGELSIALSDTMGVPESVQMSIDVADDDRLIATLLGQAAWRWPQRQLLRVSLHTAASVAASDTPVTLMRGVVRDYRIGKRRTATLLIEDALVASYRLDTEQIPKRRISTDIFADAPPESLGLPEPILYGEVSDGDLANGTPRAIASSFARGKLDDPGYSRSSAGDPVVIETTVAHRFTTGHYINIHDHDVPEANGTFKITVIDETHFAIARPYEPNDAVEATADGTATGYCYTQYALGLVPTIPVGTEEISGTTWTRFLVCGHAIHDLAQVFAAGVLLGGVGYGGPTVVGVDVLAPIPGWTATEWPFADEFRDIGGRRYTLIYAKGEIAALAVAGQGPITVNLYGIETDDGSNPAGDADSSGTLMRKALDQYRHFLINFVLGDYQMGAWLDAPVFHVSLDTTPRLDSASFDTARTLTDARPSGGYEGVVAIGVLGELQTKAEWIARWNRSCDVRSFHNLAGQFAVAVPEASTETWAHTQTDDIISDSFDAPVEQDSLRSVVPYSYARYFRIGEWSRERATVENADAIAAIGTRAEDQAQEYWCIRSETQAEELAAYRLRRLKYGRRLAIWATGLHGLASVPGSTGLLTHADAPGANGWNERRVLVERMGIDLGRGVVALTGVDLDEPDADLEYTPTPGYDPDIPPPRPEARIGQYALEVGVTDPTMRIGQFALEVGYTDPATPAQIGQFALEIAVSNAAIQLLTSQDDGVLTSQDDPVLVGAF